MNTLRVKYVKLFLRASISSAFLSAVADRFGLWPRNVSVWGNWDAFLAYTAQLNPWFPERIIPVVGAIATIAEIVFGICLLVGFKTEMVAKLSGGLLLVFALVMSFTSSIKAPFDYSVFTASAAAFALSLLDQKFFELDCILAGKPGDTVN